MEHENLTVAARSGADTDGRDVDRVGDQLGHLIGNTLDDDGKAAGVGKCLCVVDQGQRLGRLAALHPETPHGVHRLRGQPDVAHDRDLGVEQRLDHGQTLTASFELDALGAGANEDGRVAHRVLDRHVVAHPGQIADDEGPRLGARHRSGVMGDVVDRDLQGVVVAQHHHGHRITHEDHVGACGVDHTCPGGVVCGEHHERLSTEARLVGTDIRSRDFRRHGNSPSRPAHNGCRRYL